MISRLEELDVSGAENLESVMVMDFNDTQDGG